LDPKKIWKENLRPYVAFFSRENLIKGNTPFTVFTILFSFLPFSASFLQIHFPMQLAIIFLGAGILLLVFAGYYLWRTQMDLHLRVNHLEEKKNKETILGFNSEKQPETKSQKRKFEDNPLMEMFQNSSSIIEKIVPEGIQEMLNAETSHISTMTFVMTSVDEDFSQEELESSRVEEIQNGEAIEEKVELIVDEKTGGEFDLESKIQEVDDIATAETFSEEVSLDDLKSKTVAQLKVLCQQYGLLTTKPGGVKSKKEIIDTLLLHLSKEETSTL